MPVVITYTKKKTTIYIYINKLLHSIIEPNEIIGFNSFIDLRKPVPYIIEIFYKNNMVSLEYGERNKWEQVLQIIQNNIKDENTGL